MMMMVPAHGSFRLRLALDFLGGIFLPSSLLFTLLHLIQYDLGIFRIPGYVAFIFFFGVAKHIWRSIVQSRERIRLNARAIPCVKGRWPGNIDILLRMIRAFKTSYVLDVYLQLFEEYQSTVLNTRILWVDSIITMDQEHSKFILATGFHNFWRGAKQKERLETFLGGGIFNRDDEEWKFHRNMARPFFARERISDFEILETHCSRTLTMLSGFESKNAPIDAQDLYGRFTLDAASEFLFGSNLDTLSASLPTPGCGMGPKGSATKDEWGSFARAFEMSQIVATSRGRIGYFWPLLELGGDKNKPNADVIHKWLDPLVAQALVDKHSAKGAGVESPVAEKTFLQHLADSTDDPVVIRDQLLNVLLASRDTTACLLTFCTYFMAVHPDKTQKLRAEILEHCGPSAPPNYEQIRRLKYVRAFLNEVLRLFPPVPLNVRESRNTSCILPPSDGTFGQENDPRPFYMPGSTTVMYFPLLVQRNPALWGSDAHVFDPERWLAQDRLANFVKNPTMFIPFNAGPRICIGQAYAYNEASYFLVRLLQQFDSFTLASDCQPEGSLPPVEWKQGSGRQAIEQVWPAAAMTLYVKGGLWVRYRRAPSAR